MASKTIITSKTITITVITAIPKPLKQKQLPPIIITNSPNLQQTLSTITTITLKTITIGNSINSS